MAWGQESSRREVRRRKLQQETISETDPRFRRPDGRWDAKKLREYMAEIGETEPELGEVTPRHADYAVARLLSQLIEEADLFYESGLTPDNVPYNRIAHWRMAIWRDYQRGVSEGRRESIGR